MYLKCGKQPHSWERGEGGTGENRMLKCPAQCCPTTWSLPIPPSCLLTHLLFDILGGNEGVGVCRVEVLVTAPVQCLLPQLPARGCLVSGISSSDGELTTPWTGQQESRADWTGQSKKPPAAAPSQPQPCRPSPGPPPESCPQHCRQAFPQCHQLCQETGDLSVC